MTHIFVENTAHICYNRRNPIHAPQKMRQKGILMRELTIQRAMSRAAARIPAKVYIEDNSAPELTINEIPCRLLGEVKNGEVQTFSISEEPASLFVFADDHSGELACEAYPIEAGEENLTLRGKTCLREEDGTTSFCFGEFEDEEVKKPLNLKSIASLALFVAIGALLGWLIGNLVFDGFPAPAKTFTQDGYSIKLNEDFVDTGVEAYHASYESEDVVVFSSMQPYEELGGKEAYSLQEYAQMMVDDNQLTNSTVAEKRGVTYFEYEYSSGIFSYHYTVAVHEGSEGYWLTYFAVDSEDYKDYKNDIFKWARSVQVP